LHSEYYVYYGTVAAFQAGGETWTRWNGRMRDVLLPQQERAKSPKAARRHIDGSWPPYGRNWGRWGRSGGRVYATALAVLTLEIYYRHAPAYLDAPPAISAADWGAFLAGAAERDRRDAVQVLRENLLEAAEPVLVELLAEPAPAIAIEAAIALAEVGSPRGRAVLETRSPGGAPLELQPAEQALRRIVQIESLPPATGQVRLVDANRGLATVELTRAFAGMPLRAMRDGAEVARLRVLQRFTGRSVVVVEIVTGAVRSGDQVSQQ
jgi:hypothetical protein